MSGHLTFAQGLALGGAAGAAVAGSWWERARTKLLNERDDLLEENADLTVEKADLETELAQMESSRDAALWHLEAALADAVDRHPAGKGAGRRLRSVSEGT